MVPYRNILFAVLTLLAVMCLCLIALGIAGVGVALFFPTAR
jgi:hypothetical protein